MACLPTSDLSDLKAGMALGFRSDLDNTEDIGMEALIDASEHVDKALEVSASSEAQIIQIDITGWYPVIPIHYSPPQIVVT